LNLFILLLFLGMAYIQYRDLMKQRAIKEIKVSTGFLLIGVTLVILKQFQVPLPSLIMAINVVFQPIDTIVTNLLE
jgi:hypothetical protein